MIEEVDLGRRMKAYEVEEAERTLDPQLPIYARIDGRNFYNFTRGMDHPFDAKLSHAMRQTALHLVRETNARIGYTQSDEINLVWLAEGPGTEMFCGGKIQKMVSVLASMTAAKFARVCPPGYEQRFPHFDAKVLQLPSKTEAANIFLWRTLDARNTAIRSVAQGFFSTDELHGKSQIEVLNMLADKGMEFESMPAFFKRGIFIRRAAVTHKRGAYRQTAPTERIELQEVSIASFGAVKNRVEVIFDGASPIVA